MANPSTEGLGGAGGVFSSTVAGSDTDAAKKGEYKGDQGSIQESAQEEDIINILVAAPMLPPPDYTKDIDFDKMDGKNTADVNTSYLAFQMKVNEGLGEIASQILDAWIEALSEQTDKIREYLSSPAFLAGLQKLSPEAQNLEQQRLQIEEKLKTGLAEGTRKYQEGEAEASPAQAAFLGASLIAGVAFAGSIATNIVQGTNVVPAGAESTFGVEQAAWSHIAVEPAVSPTLGFIGAVFSAGAINYAGAITAKGALEGKPHTPNQVVKQYVAKIVELVTGNTLDLMIMGAIGAEKLSEERKQELVGTLKVTLLTTALVALYKQKTGWITGEEYRAMIEGKMAFDEGSLESSIIRSIQSILGTLSPNEREKVLNGLTGYADSNPDMEDLLAASNSFKSVLARPPPQDQKG